MNNTGDFSFKKFSLVFVLTGIFLSVYLRWGLSASLPDAYLKLTDEGIFPVSVAIVGVSGFLAYKYFDFRRDLSGIKSAIGAMIFWFLILLVIKFLP